MVHLLTQQAIRTHILQEINRKDYEPISHTDINLYARDIMKGTNRIDGTRTERAEQLLKMACFCVTHARAMKNLKKETK